MGKTWSGSDRKKFGKQKTRRHRSRAKWSSKNGGRGTAPRLRTLAVDVAEFQLSGGELETPKVFLPTPPPPAPRAKKDKVKKPKASSFAKRMTLDLEERRVASSANTQGLKGIGVGKKKLYDDLTTTELHDRLVFYTKQCQSMTATSRGARDAGDIRLAGRIGTEKYDFLIPEMNAIRLYLERFR